MNAQPNVSRGKRRNLLPAIFAIIVLAALGCGGGGGGGSEGNGGSNGTSAGGSGGGSGTIPSSRIALTAPETVVRGASLAATVRLDPADLKTGMTIRLQAFGTETTEPVDEAGQAELDLDVPETAPLGATPVTATVFDAEGKEVGRRSASTRVTAESARGTGRVRFSVAWPPLGRGVLDRADTLEIRLTDADGEEHSESVGRSQTEVVFQQVPVGSYSVVVEALQEGTVIGRGTYEGQVVEDQTDDATIQLDALFGNVTVTIGDSE